MSFLRVNLAYLSVSGFLNFSACVCCKLKNDCTQWFCSSINVIADRKKAIEPRLAFEKKKLINWSLLKIYSLIENLFIWKSLDVDEEEVLDEVSIHEFIVYLWSSCSLIEFLCSLLRSHFAGKPLLLSKDVGCFSGFKTAAKAQKYLRMAIEMKRKAITMLW